MNKHATNLLYSGLIVSVKVSSLLVVFCLDADELAASTDHK